MKRFSVFFFALAVALAPAVWATNNVAVLDDSAGTALTGVAKTATFNSQTVNGGDADQLCLVLDVGTVSGTSPTLDIKLQLTFDDGTTWLDTYPGAPNAETQATFAQITASSETSECWPNWLPSVGSFSSSGIVPRMRFVFTIGGTTPSFTFTNVYLIRRQFDGGPAS